MTDGIKMALIVSAGLVAAAALYTYFSPYQTCVRALDGTDMAKTYCARSSN